MLSTKTANLYKVFEKFENNFNIHIVYLTMSTETSVKASNWRLVQVGRVVLVNNKLATIVEIIDQKRVLIDGPAIQRQSISLGKTVLTPLVLEGLPRGARTATVSKKWTAADIDAKWAKTSWAKKIAQRERRSQLTDFERFQVLVLKKQRNYAVKKAIAKA
ncbi:hypothetical protein KL918_003148 [Ogataea parapolymorpha]|nr:hypothetical protein KL918_003148 [Ogataea parapolymorpha]KAG7871283.1 hypothetical protein KL916_004282 [Ogataea parapolymorpha]